MNLLNRTSNPKLRQWGDMFAYVAVVILYAWMRWL